MEEVAWRKGPWTAQEDKLLIDYVNQHGEGRWNSVAKLTGLRRSGKSCRLRWVNYLRPDLKRGKITPQEESIIIELHALFGNRWSTIARSLPGRTDNEIKNYWRTHFKKSKPSKSIERARAQFLKQREERLYNQELQLHQQLQQQREQQQQHHQQQQQEQPQQQMVDVKYVMSPEDETSPAYNIQDMELMYSYLPYLLQGSANCSSNDGFVEEDGAWGTLWNLDDYDMVCRGTSAMQPAEFALY
ncbi:hypothetical protein LUZ63_001730 [Rhynchospora breviuscula]|uniref:Uncharacterized protein n=1 Tax=Rhynchospora breviuscula TaxID=2022672 RepID=A0A9Q0HXC5_9POAL|nr:hypothetical protein LUZ63_001730 [Rhynchospora breviuscula]